MPPSEHNPLFRSLSLFAHPVAASDHTVCLKCCLAGRSPKDAPSAATLYADAPAAKTNPATVERYLGKVLADQRRLLPAQASRPEALGPRRPIPFRRLVRHRQPHRPPNDPRARRDRPSSESPIQGQQLPGGFPVAARRIRLRLPARDPSHMFLDREFFRADALERAGTLAHEMSHFLGTQDHAYGPAKCKDLARRSPTHALQNADNFEFYLEGRR